MSHRRAGARALAVSLVAILATAPFAGAVLPTTISLEAPAFLLVGQTATFAGNYRVDGVPFPGLSADVTLYVDGAAVGTGRALATPGRYTIPHAFDARGAYAVQAVADEGGLGEARSRVATVVAAVPPSAPQAVAAAVVPDAPSILLTWQPPADDGGAAISGYRIFRSTGGDWTLRAAVSGNTLSFVDPGLDLSKDHQHRVVALNPVGASGPSAAAAVPVGAAPPAPLLTVTPIDRSFDVRVQLAKTGEPTQGFLVQRSTNGGASWHTFARVSGGSADFQQSAGFAAQGDLFRAAALSFSGDSPFTAATAATADLPGAPTGFAVSTPAGLRFDWAAPADGGPLQGYTLFDNGAPLTWWHGGPVNLAHWELSHTKGSIAPGTHVFTVAGTSAAGVGAHSDPVTLTLAPASAPASFAATVTENNRDATITLTWSPPLDDGGAPILGYTVQLVSPAGPSVALPASATSYAVRMPPGQTYGFAIHARTLVGAGASATTSATVADFDLVLTLAFSHFDVCETTSTVTGPVTSCASVASGATYTRSGSGEVDVAPVYAGKLTKRGAPVEGETIGGYVVRDDDHHSISTAQGVTDANGDYVIDTWPWGVTPSGAACLTIPHEFQWDGGIDDDVATRDLITICP